MNHKLNYWLREYFINRDRKSSLLPESARKVLFAPVYQGWGAFWVYIPEKATDKETLARTHHKHLLPYSTAKYIMRDT